ncbi:MAG TPA: ABC transporter substrate-binding protein [Solirubrobacteraceae bacterium]|nr:ABC transporter substrate-binding protein [Solirubrobacteraceae bacterium]
MSPSRAVMGGCTRRQLLHRAAAAGAMFGLGGVLEACGTATGASVASAGRFEPPAGTEIPSVDVRFAMWPYGDTTIAFIGIEQGFFDDVGIHLVPPRGETRLLDQTAGELLSGQLDVSSGYMPFLIQSFPYQPDIKMIQLQDIYVGNYLLASPTVGAKRYEYYSDVGEPFARAAKAAVGQIKGKRVALSTVGNNRAFFSTLLGFSGLTPKDFELTVVDDTKILQLAQAGDIDFAMPGGAAQNVVLINEGFFRVFGIGQLLEHLPPRDPRVVTALGDQGTVATAAYIGAHTETVLRLMSVFYRIIDQMDRDPGTALSIVRPHLNAASGLSLTLQDCKVVFTEFYEFISFEQTAQHLLDRRFPLQLDNVYVPQIEAAQRGGIYRPGLNVTPEEIFVGTRLYEILTDLKTRYDRLKAVHTGRSALVTKAQQHYEHRNYLDAYRLLKAAGARAS